MPCHPKLAHYLDEYIDIAGISREKKGPLFRAALRKTKILAPRALAYRCLAWCAAAPKMPASRPPSAVRPSAPPASLITPATAGASRSRRAWPGTRTTKPPASMIAAATM